jgi:hypothetical protein
MGSQVPVLELGMSLFLGSRGGQGLLSRFMGNYATFKREMHLEVFICGDTIMCIGIIKCTSGSGSSTWGLCLDLDHDLGYSEALGHTTYDS